MYVVCIYVHTYTLGMQVTQKEMHEHYIDICCHSSLYTNTCTYIYIYICCMSQVYLHGPLHSSPLNETFLASSISFLWFYASNYVARGSCTGEYYHTKSDSMVTLPSNCTYTCM